MSGPSGRTVTGTAAVPMCRVTFRGRSATGSPVTRTSATSVLSQRSGVSSTWPRPRAVSPWPWTFTATRATAPTAVRSSCRLCRPRTRTADPSGVTSRSPTRRVPAPRVPVTTVPWPRTVNARSSHRRTSASVSGAGNPAAIRASSARSSSSPAPVTALTAT
nr:hypothetical protein [Streptomyces argyrophyllae]